MMIAAASVLVAIGASSAFGQPSSGAITSAELPTALDLTSLEPMALQRNPTLVQAGAQVMMSRGAALQAGLCPNPQVGYVAEQIGAQGTAGEMQGLFFEQEIVRGGKLQLSRQKFLAEARSAEIQVMTQRLRVLYGVRAQFYETLARQQRLEFRRKIAANADEIAKTVHELTNVGQANRPDLLQAELEQQRERARLRTAERRYQGSWEELAAVVGAPDLQITSLNGKLEFNADELLNRDDALNNLLAMSPQLNFARSEVARDEIQLRRERAEPIPNAIVRAETGYNFEAQNTTAGVQVGLRLPVFDRNQGTIMQAEGDLMRAQAEVARVDLSLRQRFAHTFTEYEAARQLAEAYRTEMLPRSQKVYERYMESFQSQRAAWPQVVDAQRDYYELYDDYLEQLEDARRAEAQIKTFFVGDPLEAPQEPTPQGHRDAVSKPR